MRGTYLEATEGPSRACRPGTRRPTAHWSERTAERGALSRRGCQALGAAEWAVAGFGGGAYIGHASLLGQRRGVATAGRWVDPRRGVAEGLGRHLGVGVPA